MTAGNRMFGSGVDTLAPNATLLIHPATRRRLSLMKTRQ